MPRRGRAFGPHGASERRAIRPIPFAHAPIHARGALPHGSSVSSMRVAMQQPTSVQAAAAAVQTPQQVVFRGKVHRRPAPSSSPSSSSHGSSSSSSSSASAPTRPVATRGAHVLADDGDVWASIRLASSPPTTATPTTRASGHYGRQSARVSTRKTGSGTTLHQERDDTVMLPLAIDDFSQDRMSRVPSARQLQSPAPILAQQPKASSWSIGRRQNNAQDAPTTSPAASLPRAQSLNNVDAMTAVPAHDITVMDHRVFVSRDQWIPHKERRACIVCDRDFGMLRKKHSCRMCGDVVCSRCSLFKNVKLPGVVGESKARVCSRCFLQYRQRIVLKQLNPDPVVDNVKPHEDPTQISDGDSGNHAEDCNGEEDESSGDDFAYDSADDLPSAEDVLRRTAVKIHGERLPMAPVAPVEFVGRRANSTPVSLLAPELMESFYRESSVHTVRTSRIRPTSSQIYGRGPSMVLLSPASTYDLLDRRLFDLENAQSFSSTISTVSSSLSSMSTASTASSMRSATEEELAAAIRARELEKEVEASRERIKELELKMQEQENKKAELSLEQQKQLSEARELIAQLQEQLKQQEQNARDAAMTRDSICLTNLRQQVHLPVSDSMPPTVPSRNRSDSVEAESEALRQKLRLLERQLQHAGINVAEVIPYAVAKQRIIDISRRMAEISEAEAVMKIQNPKGVMALRREYYVLEQDMERFHTALLMSDEYIEEQAAKEREWEQGHAHANAQALRTVRSALPVDISRLSEQTLRTMTTPSGKNMSADLARRFKRTNVLQLLRIPPQTIVRMHPSVIESYRTAGLTLIERRALHAALKDAATEWHKQSRDEIAQKKAAWFKKLKDAFVQALLSYEQHIVQHHMGDDVQCPFIGKMCLVRAEQAVAQLYAAQLGFPEGDQYYQQEIIKSDPDGAGEKALMEAKTQAMTAAKLSIRQSELKNHYGMRNVRLVTMALAALEEMDAAMERIHSLDSKAAAVVRGSLDDEDARVRWWKLCEEIVSEIRELALQLARRAGVCLTGKRDHTKDDPDTRSRLEAHVSHSATCFVAGLLEDVAATISSLRVPAAASQLKNSLPRIREILEDVEIKNSVLLTEDDVPVLEEEIEDSSSEVDDECVINSSRRAEPVVSSRLSWRERAVTPAPIAAHVVNEAELLSSASPQRMPPLPMMPRASILLDAIRSKRSPVSDAVNESSDAAGNASFETPVSQPVPKSSPRIVKTVVDTSPKTNDLFAAIRAKRSAMVDSMSEYATETVESVADPASSLAAQIPKPEPVQTPEETPKANNLLAAIRARKAKANAVSAVAPVDRAVSSA